MLTIVKQNLLSLWFLQSAVTAPEFSTWVDYVVANDF